MAETQKQELKQVDFLMAETQKQELKQVIGRRIAPGLYRGTLAQRRALQRATRQHLQLDTRNVDSLAMQVYRELKKTAILGDKVLSPVDVARVLKAEADVSGLHPNDLKTWKLIKACTGNINSVSGVVSTAGSAGGAIWTLRQWNTSYPMTELPEDFFW